MTEPETYYSQTVNYRPNTYGTGYRDFGEAVKRELSALRAEAISAERKDAYDKALALVASLLGDS